MTKAWWLLFGIAFVSAAGGAEPEKGWHAVRGAELQALLADRDLGDSVHYAYQFHRGGRLTGAEMGKKIEGTWKATARYLCWTSVKPAGSEECYEVQQQGLELRLFRDGYEALTGTLTPIEPTPSNEAKP